MNPIAGIENDKYNEHLIDYNIKEDYSMCSKTLFDAKFDNLKNNYIIRDDNSVYEFIKENESIFDILTYVKPKLDKYFNDFDYYLCIDSFPIYYNSKLALIIRSKCSNEIPKNL
jgi:hypothetical protein